MTTIPLPHRDGGSEIYTLTEPPDWPRSADRISSRTAYAAAHVVANPLANDTPDGPAPLDWESTLAFRRHLWSYGLGVADGMDTAQRGMGMDWLATAELIHRSAAEARACDGLLCCGAGTDHATATLKTVDDIVAAYEQQIEVIEDAGAGVVLLPSRQLVQTARGPEDYAKVYGRLLEQLQQPAILHWLGPMFDPWLSGYWGSHDVTEATRVLLEIIHDHSAKVHGIKSSLLDMQHEVGLRRSLPEGVALYTGDDFHYQDLIRGDGATASNALLGIFDPIAPAAASALHALENNDVAAYDEILAPTVPLARHIFGAPTYYYKTGVVFLAWLAGHQQGFTMLGGLQSARSLGHLIEAFKLADRAGLFPDPDLAAFRMRQLLSIAGINA